MDKLFINRKLNQLAELNYSGTSENPLDSVDNSIKFFIETQSVVDDLIDNLFNDNGEAYRTASLKCNNKNELFEWLNNIAEMRGMLIYPVSKYKYKNSQVNYYLGTDEGWNCNTVGFILVDIKQVKHHYGFSSKADIVNILDYLLTSYTDYMNGNVYRVNTYQLNSSEKKEKMIGCFDGILSMDANIEYLLSVDLLDGEFRDWKEE